MAKSTGTKASNPQNTPLIVSLVVFVLATVACGVLAYMQSSDKEQLRADKKKADDDLKTARTIATESQNIASLYRVVTGTADADEATKLLAEVKSGDKLSAEWSKISQVMAKKLGGDGTALPAEFAVLTTDAGGKIEAGNGKGLIDVTREAVARRDAAVKQSADDRASYASAMTLMSKASEAYKAAQQQFQASAVQLPKDFKVKMDDLEKAATKRLKEFSDRERESRELTDKLADAQQQADRKLKVQAEKISQQQTDIERIAAKTAQADTFQFDEPQGRVLRRYGDGTIEIDLGSDALVRRGLTFMVLPSDFPQRGRQSRVMREREPDGKGYFKDANVFRQKANIEVVDVLGPNLSRCRLVGMDVQGQKRLEYDDIRDRVMPGDLLYHPVWRRGVADHVALVGIFDMNGDGTDDIQSVVRDLRNMGIPVDAYFDLRTLKWEGRITERTRYVVEGHYPINTAVDPNRDKKTQLTAAMSAAIAEAKLKGIKAVGFRDFFPEMGYYVKVNVSDDKINQATARYLNAATADAPPAGEGKN
jgi:hypothetical protein